jgi:hypothetical protein
MQTPPLMLQAKNRFDWRGRVRGTHLLSTTTCSPRYPPPARATLHTSIFGGEGVPGGEAPSIPCRQSSIPGVLPHHAQLLPGLHTPAQPGRPSQFVQFGLTQWPFLQLRGRRSHNSAPFPVLIRAYSQFAGISSIPGRLHPVKSGQGLSTAHTGPGSEGYSRQMNKAPPLRDEAL